MNNQTKTYRSLFHIVVLVSFYNISSFYFGYSFVYFSSIPYHQIHEIFKVPFSQAVGEGILTGCIPAGAALGGLSVQLILSVVSRKQSFYVVNSIAVIGGIMVLITNPYLLLIGRLLQGVCVGAYSGLVPVVVKQISPIEISGAMGTIQNIFICMGFLFGYVFSYLLDLSYQPSEFFRYTFSFTLLTTVIQQLLFMTVFETETPKYLLLKGKNNEAMKMIREIYLPEFQETIYHQKLRDLEADDQFEEGQQKNYPDDNPKAIFIAMYLAIFQQLSGINIILLYGAQLAKGFIPQFAAEFPLFINIEKMVLSFLPLLIIEKFGRKRLLVVGISVLAIALFLIYLGLLKKESGGIFPILVLVGVFIYIFSFVITYGPIMWLYFPEIIQPSRVPFAVTANWLTNCLTVFLFPIVRKSCNNIDCPPVFLFLSCCMVLTVVICQNLMVQTKDKTELQIRQEFNSMKIC